MLLVADVMLSLWYIITVWYYDNWSFINRDNLSTWHLLNVILN